jgi:osmotically-inducible protein OsmY
VNDIFIFDTGIIILQGLYFLRKITMVLAQSGQAEVAATSSSTGKPAGSVMPTASMAKAEQTVSDVWITTKVKSTLLYSSNVSGNDVTVTTVGGVVTLTGKLESGAERALAIELAQNVKGVKSVHAMDLTQTKS